MEIKKFKSNLWNSVFSDMIKCDAWQKKAYACICIPPPANQSQCGVTVTYIRLPYRWLFSDTSGGQSLYVLQILSWHIIPPVEGSTNLLKAHYWLDHQLFHRIDFLIVYLLQIMPLSVLSLRYLLLLHISCKGLCPVLQVSLSRVTRICFPVLFSLLFQSYALSLCHKQGASAKVA